MYCSKCGTKAIDGAVFCQKCGAKLFHDNRDEQEPVSVPKQKSKDMIILSAGATSELEQKFVKEEESVLEDEAIQVLSSKPIKISTIPVEPKVTSSSKPVGTSNFPIGLPQAPSPKSAGIPVISTEPVTETAQDENIYEESTSPSGNDTDIYALLKENINMCPVIKSEKQVKKGVRLRGRIYNHSVRLVTVHAVQARIRSVLAFPFSILYGLLAGLLCFIMWILLWEFMKYSSICIEYYHGILFALCCFITGTVVLIHSFVGNKEKAAVATYVREIVEPKSIYLSDRKRAGAFKARIAAAVVMVVGGILILPFSLPEPIEYPDELLFDGLPAARLLEMTQEDIEAEYGEAAFINQNGITADDYYSYSRKYSDDVSHVVYSKKSGKVIYIQFSGSLCSYNQKNLDKSMVRVLDILDDEYYVNPMRFSSGVYGSIHSGFYYDDGVYLGNILGTYFADTGVEGYITQQEFENLRDYNYRFYTLRAWGEIQEGYGVGFREMRDDYEIALITVDWKYNDKSNKLWDVCLYTDEWVETVNAAGISLEQNYANETDSANMGEVLYDGILVSQFFALSVDELVEILGTPIVYDEYKLAYDNIEFELDNGKIISAESFVPEKFMIDGVTLDKGQKELIALIGKPSDEGEGGSGYQLEFSLEGCRVVIAMDEDIAWRVWLYPSQYQSGESGYKAIDLSYRGELIVNWIGGLPENAYDIFGWPDSGTIVDGYLYEGGEYFGYKDGVLFVTDYQTGQIGWIMGNTSSIIGNGYTLDKTRDELIEILGTPMMEEYAYNDMDDTSSYYMRYTLDGVELLINMPDTASRAETFIISQIVE